MFKNYFKTAWRNIRRNKLLSFVNTIGLGTGLGAVMLILLFVNDEYSFDRFHSNAGRLVRLVQTDTDTAGQVRRSGNTGVPQGPAIKSELPEIEDFCRLKGWDMTIRKGNEGLESTVLFVDSSFFRMFSFPVIKGNKATLLRDRNAVVVTEETARKYFGDKDPMGKIIEIDIDDGFEPFLVSGIVKRPPENSSIKFDMLISFERQMATDTTEKAEQLKDWGSLYLNTFFLLKSEKAVQQAESKIWPVFLKYNGEYWNKIKSSGAIAKREYSLQPFLDMHLDNRFFASNGLSDWSDSKYPKILSGLALLILIIACINFINIMLARSFQRSKEIGIRKVNGSSRLQLIIQFLSESSLVTAIACIPAIILLLLMLPAFSRFTNRHYDISYLFQPSLLGWYLLLFAMVSLLAGFYPALVASGFQPVKTIYGKIKLSGRNLIGKSLVVLQFIIAAGLITCTIVFHRQVNYMTNTDLGFSKENLIRLEFPYGANTSAKNNFKTTILQQPVIKGIGSKSGDWNKTGFYINGKKTDWTYYETMDDTYLQLLNIPLVKGRYLSYKNVADTVSNCLVNEAFVETYLDKKADPIGQTVGRNATAGLKDFRVVGIVKNYHNSSFKEKIEPMFFSLDKNDRAFNLFVQYQAGHAKEANDVIIKTYKKEFPYATLNSQFMQDWNESWYEEEIRWKEMVSYASILAIVLSCLGLFALSTLSIQQRLKEIGIRKVLGASVSRITFLVSEQFLILVIISLLIASPLAWWVLNNWLSEFAYRVNISWWIFLLTAILVIAIAMLTIGYHAVTAAAANPIKKLRTE
jgi:putative ABC transport system permease protein